MTGKQEIIIYSKHAHYKFQLNRNITIIKGNSATGKTTLFNMISGYSREGKNSGITLDCNKKCIALTDSDWENQISKTNDSIVFVDEGFRPIASKEFANAIKNSDNYYVIITRNNLHCIPYSVDEIYEIVTHGKKKHELKRLYYSNETHIYSEKNIKKFDSSYDVLISEDSNSGYQLFLKYLEDKNKLCESADSKSNIFKMLSKENFKNALVVADGAAFGSEIERVLKLPNVSSGKVKICLPESFEWLILKSGIIKEPEIADILNDPSSNIKSEKYFSWEQFFTDYLINKTKYTAFPYSKSKLNDYYLKNAEHIIEEIKDAVETK